MCYEERRTVKINLLKPTKRKDEVMHEFLSKYRQSMNIVYEACSYWDEIPNKPEKYQDKQNPTRFGIQHFVYNKIRERYQLPSQIAVDCIKDAVAAYKNNEGYVHKYIPISFNIPRSGNFVMSKKRRNSMIKFRCFKERITVPISQDNAFMRLTRLLGEGYTTTNFRIGYDYKNQKWFALVILRNEWELHPGENILGIDIGSRTLAATTTLKPGKHEEDVIIGQHYFGRDMWNRQRNISLRRGKLKSHLDKDDTSKEGKKKAKRLLRKLNRKETNYVKTRSFQIAHEITNMAAKNDCTISIENLNGLKDKKGTRRANRKKNRIPYSIFQSAIEDVSARKGVQVVKVKPHYTSQTCSRCGKKGKRSENLKMFKCERCGYHVNADRNASVNIARRANLDVLRNTCDKILNVQPTTGSMAVAPYACSNMDTACEKE